jgi:cobalt/nickel transport system permease protein
VHVPDGFLDASTSAATALLAAGTVAVALRQARAELDERAAPLAGLVAAFVFAVQMLNFPVGVGTSGHLMGGALAAVLVGPWTAVLCLTVVLVVQALLFADGGLSALGTNVTLIALVTVLVGYAVTRAVLYVLPARPASVVSASFVGALLSVPAAAAVFTGLYALGGAVDLPLGALLATMLGWHTLIGVGEALITAFTVSAVVAARPDLVHAARGRRPAVVLLAPDGTPLPAPPDGPGGAAPSPRSRPPGRRGLADVVVLGTVAALLLAGVASFFASDSPDGLERAAGDRGFLDAAGDSALAGLPTAGYGEVGGIPVGLAGVLGVVVTVLVGYLVVRLALSRAARRPAARGRHPVERVGAGSR